MNCAQNAQPSLYQAIYPSPLGILYLQCTSRAITGLAYQAYPSTHPIRHLPLQWQHALNEYFAGEFAALDQLPIELLQGTTFQQQVWQATRHIPVGQTISYQQLAIQINRPNACRAVGQALRHNPIAIILPCHRIVKQSGDLGGYAGISDLGRARKHFLLWHEGVVTSQRHQSQLPSVATQ
jgi:methylated-DNA-[protein]-cysteine S-methyltransferase